MIANSWNPDKLKCRVYRCTYQCTLEPSTGTLRFGFDFDCSGFGSDCSDFGCSGSDRSDFGCFEPRQE